LRHNRLLTRAAPYGADSEPRTSESGCAITYDVLFSDYWDLATVLELGAIGNDWVIQNRVVAKTLAAGKASWMIKTTWDNLLLLKAARERAGQSPPEL
jgi:hypothetical protein